MPSRLSVFTEFISHKILIVQVQKRPTGLQNWLESVVTVVQCRMRGPRTSLALDSSCLGQTVRQMKGCCHVKDGGGARGHSLLPRLHLSLLRLHDVTRVVVWAQHPPAPNRSHERLHLQGSFPLLFQDIFIALEKQLGKILAGQGDDGGCYGSYSGTHGWAYN